MVSMMDQGSTSMKTAAPNTADYGVNIKVWLEKVIASFLLNN